MVQTKGKIYKIINSKNDKVYFGSTSKKRLQDVINTHKRIATRNKTRLYDEMNAIGFQYFTILLVEEVDAVTKSDLLKIKDMYIKKIKEQHPELCLNMHNPIPYARTGKVYKIINSKNDKVYFGSTFKKRLQDRMNNHKSDAARLKMMLYDEMNAIGFQYFNILLIEEVDAKTKSDLLKIEEKYMNEFREQHPELCLNKIRAYCSVENKKIRNREMYFRHKEKQYTRRRAVITSSEESHQKYKDYCKTYYQINKHKWTKNNGEKVLCDCGRNVSKANFKRHKASPMHARFLARLNAD